MLKSDHVLHCNHRQHMDIHTALNEQFTMFSCLLKLLRYIILLENIRRLTAQKKKNLNMKQPHNRIHKQLTLNAFKLFKSISQIS